MSYSSDSPISSAEESVFSGRKEYAQKVAESIRSLDRSESYVIGLYSKWGYGKTSLINLIKNDLNNTAKDENDSRIFCIDVEPWSYVSSENMAGKIYYEVIKRCYAHGEKKKLKGYLPWIKGFYIDKKDNIKFTVNKIASVNSATAVFGELFSHFDFVNARTSLEELIRDSDLDKIVVFIDDIDRLNSDEILNVFKLVKSVANIRGIVFFLAFDYDVVVNALNQNTKSSEKGKNFIEKIIQIPIELSYISHDELMQVFNDGLNDILAENAVEVVKGSGQETNYELTLDRLQSKLDTPRAINRLLNAIRFVVPMLKDETNIYDLLSLEIIRVLKPELYSKIRENKNILTGQDYSIYNPFETNEQMKQRIEKIFENEENLQILRILFPEINKICFVNNTFRDEKMERLEKKVCSPIYFERYFRYSRGKNEIIEDEFVRLISGSHPSKKQITEFLHSSQQCTRFLQMLQDNSEMIANKYELCYELVLALEDFDWAFEDDGIVTPSIVTLFRVINNILLDEPKSPKHNLELFKHIITCCKRLATLSYLIRSVYRRNNYENKDDERILDEVEYDIFKKYACKDIERKMRADLLPLQGTDIVSRDLYYFDVIFSGSNEIVNVYVRNHVTNVIEAIDFVSYLLDISIDMSSKLIYREDFFSNNFSSYRKWFTDVFDPSYLYNIIASSSEYSIYKNSDKNVVPRFDNIGPMVGKRNTENLLGNENTDKFREIIARQFMYIYEQDYEDKSNERDKNE